MTKDGIELAAYYFPNYHTHDARNDRVKGDGWAEWKLVKEARPCFEGHQQPKVPAWGYTDEKDPKEMARKIKAAADNGIDVFIFDWYYYDDGPFLNRALDEGFLGAKNCDKLQFALMWANHDWLDIHPYTKGNEQKILYPGRVTPETFEKIGDLIIKEYFSKPNYWKIDGKPYFSIYDLARLCENFGGVAALRRGLEGFRRRAEAAGLPGIHLNLTSRGEAVLPGEKAAKSPELIHELGFDSVTSYIWIHHMRLPDFPRTDYRLLRRQYLAYWREAGKRYRVPFHPNIMTAWDASPRSVQSDVYQNGEYPYGPVVENSPEVFEETLRIFRQQILLRPPGERVITINAWNEWTEGAYLEPDEEYGFAYLDAIKRVFGFEAEKKHASK